MIDILIILALPALVGYVTGRKLCWANNWRLLASVAACVIVVPLLIYFALCHNPTASHNIAAALSPEYQQWHGRHHRGEVGEQP